MQGVVAWGWPGDAINCLDDYWNCHTVIIYAYKARYRKVNKSSSSVCQFLPAWQ